MNSFPSRIGKLILAVSLIVPAAQSSAFKVRGSRIEDRGFRVSSNLEPRTSHLLVSSLPVDAPREGLLIAIDVSTNTAYLVRDGAMVATSSVATGSDKILRRGSNVWFFRTPRGRMNVVGKIVDPIWTKPDWAFIEEGKKVPPPDSPARRVRGKLGRYALDLGGGVLIHGTDDPKSIGKKASHGCIRMPAPMLKRVFEEAEIGTAVYIFDSSPQPLSMTGLNSLDMR